MSRVGNKIINVPEGVTVEVASDNTVTVKGAEGEKIIFKVNNQKEVAVVCTGAEQTVSLDLSELALVEANVALIMFPGAGVAGATGEFVVYSMVFGN